MSSFPLVTIAVASFNSGATILETLNSVLDQTYKNVELIITDDCSRDNTIEIVKKWVDENRSNFCNILLLESIKNHGTCYNLNKAIKTASGEWIKFIGADDSLMPSCIEDNIKYINRNHDVLYLCSKSRDFIDCFDEECEEDNSDFYNRIKPVFQLDSQEQLYYMSKCHIIASPTLFFKTSLLKEIGGFDEQYYILEDAPLILILLEKGFACRFMDIYTVKYRKRGKSEKLYNVNLVKCKKKCAQNLRIKYFNSYERFSYWLKYYFIISFCKLGLNHNNLYCKALHKIFSLVINFIASKKIYV